MPNTISTDLLNDPIPMSELQPGQLGRVVGCEYPGFSGRLVMGLLRAQPATLDTGEVWTDPTGWKVVLLPVGTKVTITAGS